jgi:CDP-diacylglycerol--glycerol-3-phosphate 3-phosphatidyltransferase
LNGRDCAFPVAAVLTLWSMLQYLNAARGDLLDQ